MAIQASVLPKVNPLAQDVNRKVHDILLGIDGTGSEKWLNSTGGNSHVFQFVTDFIAPKDDKRYLHGPGDLGFDVSGIVDAGLGFIVGRLQHAILDRTRGLKPNDRVTLPLIRVRLSMVGHSRGGLIAVLIAKRLKEYTLTKQIPLVHVHFLELYDAVDRHVGPEAKEIPGNVISAYHAIRDPTVQSRNWFGNTGTKALSPCRYQAKIFSATHSAMGGDPWNGDKPKQITQQIDELGSDQVGQWMRDCAKRIAVLRLIEGLKTHFTKPQEAPPVANLTY